MKTVEEIEEGRRAEAAVSDAVRAFRQRLLNVGFRHANSAGELVSQDDTTWIGTTYTHGEYSVYAWRRPAGHAELGEQRYVIRVTPYTDLSVLERIGSDLTGWARTAPTNHWPVDGMSPVR